MVWAITVIVGMGLAGLLGLVLERRSRDPNWAQCPLQNQGNCNCGIRSPMSEQVCWKNSLSGKNPT